jgi:hypothetical protein
MCFRSQPRLRMPLVPSCCLVGCPSEHVSVVEVSNLATPSLPGSIPCPN